MSKIISWATILIGLLCVLLLLWQAVVQIDAKGDCLELGYEQGRYFTKVSLTQGISTKTICYNETETFEIPKGEK